MRSRLAARLLVLDPDGRVLLFRFAFSAGVLAGRTYWATPGGAVEPDENYLEAARRELLEETGLALDAVAGPVADKKFILELATGERVMAEEQYFVVRVPYEVNLSIDRWTPDERDVIADRRWWSISDLIGTTEIVFPKDLPEILASVRVERT